MKRGFIRGPDHPLCGKIPRPAENFSGLFKPLVKTQEKPVNLAGTYIAISRTAYAIANRDLQSRKEEDMKKLQAKLFMVLVALIMAISTSTVASAAQKQLSEAPVSETSTQGVYKILVMIVDIICPLPLEWPVV